jgi:hypothetical protein
VNEAGTWGSMLRVPISTCSSSESGMGKTRVAALGVAVEFAGKQREISSRKYERKTKNRSSIKMVMQAIIVACRRQ